MWSLLLCANFNVINWCFFVFVNERAKRVSTVYGKGIYLRIYVVILCIFCDQSYLQSCLVVSCVLPNAADDELALFSLQKLTAAAHLVQQCFPTCPFLRLPLSVFIQVKKCSCVFYCVLNRLKEQCEKHLIECDWMWLNDLFFSWGRGALTLLRPSLV